MKSRSRCQRERERERERESNSGGTTNMVNAQTWLQETFLPQNESSFVEASQLHTVILVISNQPGEDQAEWVDCGMYYNVDIRGSRRKYYNLNLEGELDLGKFTNLIDFELIGQNNLTVNNWWKSKNLRAECKAREVLKLRQIINNLNGELRDLPEKVRVGEQEIRIKEQTINQLQTQLNTLNTQLTTKTQEFNLVQVKVGSLEEKVNGLNVQLVNLKDEKKQLTAQKDTFQKSADYLRETLKSTEKTLEDIKQQLASAQETSQKDKDNHQQALTNKEEELRQRQEAFKVISERNTDLTNKLSQSSSEIDQLSQWISKLESASVEGDAFTQLKQDLAQAQNKVQELQEQLNTKQPKNYWWIYVVVALIGIYFIVK